jgi:hypothetical protein
LNGFSRRPFGCVALVLGIAALSHDAVAADSPGDYTSFWTFHADAWKLDSITDSSGSIAGASTHVEYEWPSDNQREDLPYSSDPVVFRNWELEHPAIRRWRLNTNAIRVFGGTAAGKNLERTDPDTERRFFEIDNLTRYVGVEARYWVSNHVFVEAGIAGSFDHFNGREDRFVHERLYNQLGGAIAWTPAQFRIEANNSVAVGPVSTSGVFNGPSPLSGASYTLSNVGPVTVFAPNANDVSVAVVNAGRVDVYVPNGDGLRVATDTTGAVTIDAPNGDNALVLARRAASLEVEAANGDDLRVVGVQAGTVDVQAPNGDDFRVLVVDSGDVVVQAPNGENGRVEVLRSGNLTVESGDPAQVAAERSGTTTSEPATQVAGTVSSTFNADIEEATRQLPPTPSSVGAVLSIDLPMCSLSVVRSTHNVRIISTSSQALNQCVDQFVTDDDAAGFGATNTMQTRFFDVTDQSMSGKARVGYRGERLLLSRLPMPIMETVSGGLTFETSPQGNGIGRAGSWVDASYEVGIQLHSNPRRYAAAENPGKHIKRGKFTNPFPRFLEIRARYVREVADFQTSWIESRMGLHGSFGLRNPDSSSRIRHYSVGYNYIDFNGNQRARNAIDFRLNHRQHGFGVGFVSVDLVVFRKSALQFSYTASKVQFEGLRSNWQDQVGVMWSGHL